MRLTRLTFFLALFLVLGSLACAKGKEKAVGSPSLPAVTTSAAGGVEIVEITSSGKGATRDEAIRDAVLRAIEQVHGRAVSMTTVSQELGAVEKKTDKSLGPLSASKSETERVTAGGKRIEESTKGMVTGIRIVEEVEGRKGWDVTLVALVAKFTPPGGNKPRVVVGLPKGSDISADAATVIRERIGGALMASGKVAVLDRSDNGEVNAELELAASGSAAATENLKVGQNQVADFIVQVTVDALRVDRSARKMRTSNREIVSYTGSANASFRLVHVATRQVMGSGTATASRSSDESLQDTVNADVWMREMIDEVAGKLAAQVADALVKTGPASKPTVADSAKLQ